jgi:tetratricopeptide (TPR) repeat protein
MDTRVNSYEPQRSIALALGLAQEGHLRPAAHLLRLVNQARPDPEITALAARCLLEARDPEAARTELEIGAQQHGWDSETRFLRLVSAARAGQLAEAIEFADELSDDPDRGVDARVLLGELHLRADNLEAARHAADSALRERPDSVDALLVRAAVAGAEGDREQRLALIERARKVDPDSPRVQTALGMALLNSGRRAEGQRAVASVLAKRPGDPMATRALLGSSFRTQRERRVVLAVLFLTPLISALLDGLLPKPEESGPPPRVFIIWFWLWAAVFIAIRIFDRVRTDRSVAAIKRTAHRHAMHGQPLLPTLRPVRWILIGILAGLWVFFDLATLFMPSSDPTAIVLVVGLPGWGVLFLSVLAWRRRREQLARGEPRRFDPASCHCHTVSKLGERRASAYIRRHLVFELAVLPREVDRYRCPLLETRWLYFSGRQAIAGETGQLAVRLPSEFVPRPGRPDGDSPTGFYL